MHPLRRALCCGALLIVLSACGAPAAQQAASPSSSASPPAVSATAATEVAAVKDYLQTTLAQLKSATTELAAAADAYYQLANAAGFDYAALWQRQPDQVRAAVERARAAWKAASPRYEQVEGIVAGVAALAEYDVILDAGASGEEDPANAVPFDLRLPDGRVLPKPGNLFGVTESALWGTFADYRAPNVTPDLNGNGTADFGDALPEANVLKAAAAELDRYTGELQQAAAAWQPSREDALTALVVMVPTMSEYFESWKNSRFVAGEQSTQRDFVAISRLADIQDILSGLQVVYASVKPAVAQVDAQQAEQIERELADLKAFVADVYRKEQGGQRFTPEEADLLGAEAQNRATAITGKLVQAAARLNITIEE